MPKRTDFKKILLIGSGPIVIGQACEFDYSGTQACKALREEGYEVVLINSNPATIMTDPDTAERTYIEPLVWEIVEKGARTKEETHGRMRWMVGYNEALLRNDLRAACRVLVGDDSLEAALGFRGWLLAQGEAVVHAAVHDLDSLLEVATAPVSDRRDLIGGVRDDAAVGLDGDEGRSRLLELALDALAAPQLDDVRVRRRARRQEGDGED